MNYISIDSDSKIASVRWADEEIAVGVRHRGYGTSWMSAKHSKRNIGDIPAMPLLITPKHTSALGLSLATNKMISNSIQKQNDKSLRISWMNEPKTFQPTPDFLVCLFTYVFIVVCLCLNDQSKQFQHGK